LKSTQNGEIIEAEDCGKESGVKSVFALFKDIIPLLQTCKNNIAFETVIKLCQVLNAEVTN